MRAPSPHTFFVDRSLGTRDVPTAIAKVLLPGETVLIHDDIFPQDAVDQAWLLSAGKHGWIALSKDDAIRRRPGKVSVMWEHGLRLAKPRPVT